VCSLVMDARKIEPPSPPERSDSPKGCHVEKVVVRILWITLPRYWRNHSSSIRSRSGWLPERPTPGGRRAKMEVYVKKRVTGHKGGKKGQFIPTDEEKMEYQSAVEKPLGVAWGVSLCVGVMCGVWSE